MTHGETSQNPISHPTPRQQHQHCNQACRDTQLPENSQTPKDTQLTEKNQRPNPPPPHNTPTKPNIPKAIDPSLFSALNSLRTTQHSTTLPKLPRTQNSHPTPFFRFQIGLKYLNVHKPTQLHDHSTQHPAKRKVTQTNKK